MSTPDPWPPLPGTPAIEALVAEVTRLRWRVEQLEIAAFEWRLDPSWKVET